MSSLRTTVRLLPKTPLNTTTLPKSTTRPSLQAFRAISSTHPTQSPDHHQVIDPIMERLWQFSRDTSAAVANMTSASQEGNTAERMRSVESELQRVDDVLGDPIMEKLWDLKG